LSSASRMVRSSGGPPFRDGRWRGALLLRRLEPEDVARLAVERLADRVEGGEAERARLAGLEKGEVGQGHPDPFRELGEGHPPVVEDVVQLHFDGQVTRSLRGLRASPSPRRTPAPGGK